MMGLRYPAACCGVVHSQPNFKMLRLPTALGYLGLRLADKGEIENLFRPHVAGDTRKAFAPVYDDLLQPFRNRSVARDGFHMVVVNPPHEIAVFVPGELHDRGDSLLAMG